MAPQYSAQQAYDILKGAQQYLPQGTDTPDTAIDTESELNRFMSTVYPGSEQTVLSTASGAESYNKDVLPKIQEASAGITAQTDNAEELAQPDLFADDEEKDLYQQQLDYYTEAEKNVTDAYKNLATSIDESTQAQITMLTDQFNERKQLMEQSLRSNLATWKQAFTRTGQSEYSPGMTQDFVTAKEQAGQREIAKLDAEYRNLVAGAQAAAKQQKFSLAAEQAGKIDTIKEKMFKLMEDQAKEAQAVNRSLQADQAVFTAMNQGLTSVQDIFKSTKGSFTTKEIKESLANFAEQKEMTVPALTGDLKNFFELKQNYPDYLPLSIRSLPPEQQLSAYVDWVEKGKAKGAKSSGVLNTLPGMSGYDASILTSRIARQIYGKTASDKESARVENFIAEGMRNGKSELDIIDDVLGFKVTRNKPLAENLRNSLLSVTGADGLAGFDMAGIARLINDGKDALAVQTVEQSLYNKAKEIEPDSYIGESSARFASQKTDEVRKLIEDMRGEQEGLFDFDNALAEAPIGVVKGTMQNWLGRFRGEDATKVRSSITALVAEMRNRLSGTAVTESEAKFLEPLIPSLSDSPANFMAKLKQLETDPLLRLNIIRQTFNMPTLTKDTLQSTSKRVPLYMESTDPLEVTSPNTVNNPLQLEL